MVPTAVPFSQRSIFETVEESRHNPKPCSSVVYNNLDVDLRRTGGLERERGTMVFLLFGMDAEAAALNLRYISVLMNNRSISD